MLFICAPFICLLFFSSSLYLPIFFFFFFFNDTATTEIYTLSLHDALPICRHVPVLARQVHHCILRRREPPGRRSRSEEHTSELQSPCNLVCRLLLEKKKKKNNRHIITQNTRQAHTHQPTRRRPQQPVAPRH